MPMELDKTELENLLGRARSGDAEAQAIIELLSSQRAATLQPGSFDADKRTVRAVITTDAPVRMIDWENSDWGNIVYIDETLRMDGLEIRGGRKQVPLQDSHGRWAVEQTLGSVVDIKSAAHEATATLRFAETEEGERAFRLVRDGHLTDVSIGYAVKEKVRVADGETLNLKGETYKGPALVGTRWELREVSVVAIGADVGAMIRSFVKEFGNNPAQPGDSHTKEARHMPEPTNPSPGTMPAKTDAERQAELDKAREEGAVRERNRIEGIRQLGVNLKIDQAQIEEQLKKAKDVEEARAVFCDILCKRNETTPRGPAVDVGADEGEKFRAAALDGVLLGRGIALRDGDGKVRKEAPGANEFRHLTISGLAQRCLLAEGGNPARVLGMSKERLLFELLSQPRERAAFFPGDTSERAGHGTGHFPYILANVMNKSLQRGYEESRTTYQLWVSIVPRQDFKTNSVVALSNSPDFVLVNEGGEVPHGSLSEKREQYALDTAGIKISISRQALINDDLSAFTRIPRQFGSAGRRRLNKKVYARLIGGAGVGETMADTGALFNATAQTTAGGHANYTSSGTAISVTSLGVGRASMSKIRGFASTEETSGEVLNIEPAYLLTGPTKATIAEQVLRSASDPAISNSAVANPFYNKIMPIGDALLETGFTLDGTAYTGSSTKWYLAASADQIDTVELGLLNGVDAPTMYEVENAGDVLGLTMVAYIDGAAKAVDYRGLYLNAGA